MKRFSKYILYIVLTFFSNSSIVMLNANNLPSYEEEKDCSVVSMIIGKKILEGNNSCDQVFDPNVDQVGVGFVFDLIDHNTGTIIATAQSDASGDFVFNNLSAGTYTVRERQEYGWLGIPFSIEVTLGTQSVETVEFFNCPFVPNILAGCVYGDITANPTNNYNEKGLAVVHNGGFFNNNNTIVFSSTNLPITSTANDEHLVGKKWDNPSGLLQTNTTITDFSDVSNTGAHFIDNLYVLETNIPCYGGTFAGVGTIRNGGNMDVFYSEFNADGTMLHYKDITSTPSPDGEKVHELIELSNNDLMWVGTQRASPFPIYNEPMISKMTSCPSGLTHQVLSFQDNNGQTNGTGRSILELDTALPGHPNAKYAVTGSIGNKAYLLLLGATNNPICALAYDIDGNTNSSAEGIRIRRVGNNLLIIGNFSPTGSFGTPLEEKIFLLKLGFLGQQNVPTILVNKIYDIPGGDERVVDAEVNFNGDLILTGLSALSPPGTASNGQPELQKTFLMGLDPFGNQLWLNQVQLQEGSEPADLQLFPLFDNISIVGSCWTNEQVNNGGTISNRRKFDEMIFQATPFGEVGFNTGCTIPLDASVSEPVAVISDFIATPSSPVFTIEDGSLYYDDYTMVSEYCTEGQTSNVDCDEVSIAPQVIDDPNNACCYSLDYQNNSPAPLYELCLRFPGTPSATFSNVATDPNFTFSLNSTNTDLKIRSASSSTLPFGSIAGAIDFCITGASNVTIAYLWKDISGDVACEQADVITCDVCEADFTFTTNCFDVILNGTASGINPPYTFQWDIDCDGIDYTGQTANHTFPSSPSPGTYDICLIVTDAAGDTCNIQKQVTVSDTTPPDLNCPNNTTINTDPGECFGTYILPTPTDNCDPSPMGSCQLSGATSGTGITASSVQLNKGTTTITCFIEDASGNMNSCSFDVTVVDNENPVITCPANINTSVPGCDGGDIVVFPDPTVSDNCPMVTWTYSHQSEDFFDCGTTTVTAIATDMSGNTSNCSFNINVNCLCAEVVSTSAECHPIDENAYDFSVTLNSLTGLSNPSQFCTGSLNLAPTITNISLSNLTSSWNGTQITFTGTATVTGCDFPDDLAFLVNFNCNCPQAPPIACEIPVNIQAPCCRTISIDDGQVCEEATNYIVPINNIGNFCDIQQVKWYVADAPCPPSSWGAPFQVTNTYLPLSLAPKFHNTDICVYAEITLGSGDGGCEGTIQTAPATITLCEPIGCSISGQSNYCYFTGSPIVPAPLVGSITPTTPNCPYTVQWHNSNGPISGETGLSYQPPALSLPNGSMDCFQDFTYTMRVTGECPPQDCSFSIRLYNDDAPEGVLELDPLKNLPLCYGDDATLRYTPECVEPEEWNWFISTDNITYTPIPNSGNKNPLWNTNRLYQDTWYRIEKKNGSCLKDQIDFLIPVNPPLSITNFTADASPFCNPTEVDMSVTFGPNLVTPYIYNIDWYKNGQIIHSSTSTGGTELYTYTPPSPDDIAGNYYVIISSSCCNETEKSNVEIIDPPCEVAIAGPCFRCNEENIDLTGIVTHPIAGATCTYQWYDENGPISGATGTMLNVKPHQDGPFRFEKTCTKGAMTCTKSATFILKQCGANTALAAKLLDFQATAEYEFVLLDWTVSNEENDERFDIERSQDGETWETIGFVAGKGASIENQSYLFKDFKPWKGINYYRLKQTDNNGDIEYSSIEEVFFNAKQAPVLNVFPNPVKADLTFSIKNENLESYTFQLIDYSGRIITSWNNLSGDSHSFSTSDLPSGVYTIMAKSHKNAFIGRFIKQ